jgi:hypothetical protein
MCSSMFPEFTSTDEIAQMVAILLFCFLKLSSATMSPA